MVFRRSQFGAIGPRPRSDSTVLMVEPTLGFRSDQPASDLQPGETPYAQNFLMWDGGLEPRPCLSQQTTNPNPMGVPLTGGLEVISSVGSRYPLISGTTRFAYHDGTTWSVLSYVSSFGYTATPSGSTMDYYDACQIYYPPADDMLAVLACQSYQTLFCWRSGSTLFSSLTGAPRARYVAPFDNFVVAFNVRDAASAQSKYVQRVQWSDRGAPSNWTGGLSGFEDLLDAKGQGTRIFGQEQRMVLFFEDEIWQAYRGTYPNIMQFAALDRTVGTPFSWTAVDTPVGIIFLGRDYMLYVLPKDGGTAQPIGGKIQQELRNTIDSPAYAWATYDPRTSCYQLYYPVVGSGSIPAKAMYYNIRSGSFAPQAFDQSAGPHYLTRGFPAFHQTGTAGLTWDNLTTLGYTWNTIPGAWNDYNVISTLRNRVIFTGSSAGTMYRLDSNATNDDGITVEAVWRSGGLGVDDPSKVKTLTEVRLDYNADVQSSATVWGSSDQGQTFDAGQIVTLLPSSTMSEERADVYSQARYPMFEVRSSDHDFRLYRFWAKFRSGGR